MIEDQPTEIRVSTCDMPGCNSSHEAVGQNFGAGLGIVHEDPPGWRTVRIPVDQGSVEAFEDGDRLCVQVNLCDVHQHLAETLMLATQVNYMIAKARENAT